MDQEGEPTTTNATCSDCYDFQQKGLVYLCPKHASVDALILAVKFVLTTPGMIRGRDELRQALTKAGEKV